MIKHNGPVENLKEQKKHVCLKERQWIYILLLIGFLFLLILTGISTGPFAITIRESFKAVIQGITGINTGIDAVKIQIGFVTQI